MRWSTWGSRPVGCRAGVWLAEHLAGHAGRRGARVLWVRCWEAGGAPPFWPWTQVFLVAELARAVGLGGRDRRAASHAERPG
jgi:hypothetical protein